MIAGTILCTGARALARSRDPGTLPLVVDMAPLSPAVVLGLPVGLWLLRTLARPEVTSFLRPRPGKGPEDRLQDVKDSSAMSTALAGTLRP